jgi:hypothetical protein
VDENRRDEKTPGTALVWAAAANRDDTVQEEKVDSGVGDTRNTAGTGRNSAAPGRYFSENLPWTHGTRMNQGEEAERADSGESGYSV